MNHIVIGKKELFAFAERYAGKKVKEYSALEDGEVVALILNKIFPSFQLIPASHRTYSFSQRCQYNWELIFRHFARVHIPLVLLHTTSFGELNSPNSHRFPDVGFSTLALLYFLFHLSKRPDFSAEFAEDVPEVLMEYLQSLDSIASLLIGEALDWNSLPADAREEIRALPAFHTTPEEDSLAEKEAVKWCRLFLGKNNKVSNEGKEKTLESGKREKKRQENRRENDLCKESEKQSHPRSEMNLDSDHLFIADAVSLSSGKKLEIPSLKPHFSRSSSYPAPSLDSKESTTVNSATAEALNAAWERERQLLLQLSLKTEECEKLHSRELDWIDKFRTFSSSGNIPEAGVYKETNVKSREENSGVMTGSQREGKPSSQLYRFLYEKEHEKRIALEARLHGMARDEGGKERSTSLQEYPLMSLWADRSPSRDSHRLALRKKAESFLDDVRDPETQERIHPHSVAHTLQEWISSLTLSGGRTEETKKTLLFLLRSLWMGYTELEKRLVEAVDILNAKMDALDRVEDIHTGEHCHTKNDKDRATSPLSVAGGPSLLEKNAYGKGQNDVVTNKDGVFALAKAREEMDELVKGVRMLFTTACRREEEWRTLCGKLYQVEKITSALAEQMELKKASEKDIKEATLARKAHYAEIERLTGVLLRIPSSQASRKQENEEHHSTLHDMMASLDKSFSRLGETLHVP